MTEKLRDPNLPPGAIVEKREDGIWVRNDGVELSPAEKNPYYVLATVCGEHGQKVDWELHNQNRRIWNGWACTRLNQDQRIELAASMGIESGELAPLTDEEMAIVKQAFRSRLGRQAKIPSPDSVVFQRTYFSQSAVWKQCVFGSAYFPTVHFEMPAVFSFAQILGKAEFTDATFLDGSNFESARFQGVVEFWRSRFNKDALFSSATFVKNSWFSGVNFLRQAVFSGAQFPNNTFFNDVDFSRRAWYTHTSFLGLAQFTSSRFHGSANFGFAIFKGPVEFSKALFQDEADFSDGAFGGRTDFSHVTFSGAVPDFFQRSFHDNTKFNLEATHWPAPDVGSAGKAKDAYRRLRQVSASQYNPESEHFFLRREMECASYTETHWLSRLIIKGYGWLSGFGYSVLRPARGLLATWVGGSLTMQFQFAWHYVFNKPFDGTNHIPELSEALWLGLANTIAIFGFRTFYFGETYMTGLPAFVKVLGGAQTILGFVFLFFLGLGLRNRFRLK